MGQLHNYYRLLMGWAVTVAEDAVAMRAGMLAAGGKNR
jgi:hypothetical protein